MNALSFLFMLRSFPSILKNNKPNACDRVTCPCRTKSVGTSNIIDGSIKEPQWGCNGENPKVEINTKDMNAEMLKAMLDRVTKAIENRSKAIQKCQTVDL